MSVDAPSLKAASLRTKRSVQSILSVSTFLTFKPFFFFLNGRRMGSGASKSNSLATTQANGGGDALRSAPHPSEEPWPASAPRKAEPTKAPQKAEVWFAEDELPRPITASASGAAMGE